MKIAPGLAAGAVLPALLAAAVALGCGPSVRPPPTLVRDFADSVANRDWVNAYARMSASYRQRVPFAKFRADMEAEHDTVAADAAALPRAGVVATRAEMNLATGEHIDLILEDDVWKLETQPLDPFGQDSPRAALRTFVRAVDRHRYDVLLRLIPVRRRARISEDVLRAYWEGAERQTHLRLIERLRASLNAPIVNLGEEALMPFGDQRRSPAEPTDEQGEVHFLSEGGVWKIDDAD